MRTLVRDLRAGRRPDLKALYERHKAGIGYVLLACGVAFAIAASFEALHTAEDRVERQAGVICANTVQQDKSSLANLYTKSGHELLRSFHLTIPQARALIHKQLVQSAKERMALQPSNPRSACTPRLTTLSAKEVRSAARRAASSASSQRRPATPTATTTAPAVTPVSPVRQAPVLRPKPVAGPQPQPTVPARPGPTVTVTVPAPSPPPVHSPGPLVEAPPVSVEAGPVKVHVP